MGYSGSAANLAVISRSVPHHLRARSIHDPRYLEFVAALRRRRQRLGLTQKGLAYRLGRPQSFVAKVERGERRLDVIEAMDYCAALGCDLRESLPVSGPHSSVGEGGT